MFTYLSLLRGINVGGNKIFNMNELVDLYNSLGFDNVKYYLRSGNIIFCSTQKNTDIVKSIIEEKIFEKYKLNIPVIVLSSGEINNIITALPFNLNEMDISKLYVTFLEQQPEISAINSTLTDSNNSEKFIIMENVVYLFCPNGYGRTKFNNNFFERKLKVKATTRNWKTTSRLWEMFNEVKCEQN